MVSFPYRRCSGDQMKEREMGEACGTYGGEEQFRTSFWLGKLNERDRLEELGVRGRIILKLILKT